MIEVRKLVTILSFISVFTAYSFWRVIKEKFDVAVFYPLTAVAFVGFTYVIFLFFKKDDKFRPIARIIYLSSYNNLIDELFFNPKVLSINEYVGFSIIIFITLYKEYSNGHRRKGRVI